MIHYLITALIDFAVCIYALRSNTKAPKTTAFLSASIGIWSLELFFLSYITDKEQLQNIFHLTRWGMFFMPAAFTLLTHQLVNDKNNHFFKFVALPCLITSSILCLLNTFSYPSTLKQVDSGYIPEKDLIYLIFVCEIVYAAIFTMAYSIVRFKASLIRDKHRLIWGSLLALLFFGLGLILTTLMGKDYYLSNFLGSFANITYIISLLYVTNTKSLMDLKKALSVSAAHILTLFLILSTNAYLISYLSGFELSFANTLIISAVLAPTIILYSSITKASTAAIEKIIVRDSYNVNSVSQHFEKHLNDANTTKQLTDALEQLFSQTIKLKNFDLFIIPSLINDDSPPPMETVNTDLACCENYATKNKHIFFSDEASSEVRSYMRKNSYELIVPLFFDNTLSALLCIGEPVNLNFFRQEDIRVFKWLQTMLPPSIERITNLETMESELNQSRKTLSMLSVMNQYNHDIKTPLAVIDGVISTNLYDQEKQREIIMEQVTKGTQLIATMADILRGKRKRDITLLSLQEILQHCVILFENRFEKIDCEFLDSQKISGDAIDLKILFANIIKNSTEAADPRRALTLSIKTREDDDYIYTSLRDTGTGISEDEIEQLWERNDSSKKTGNAIGLQAIKRIAEEHNAIISVTSNLDHGTTFELKFPRQTHVTQLSTKSSDQAIEENR